jgi:uncharacterized protein (DUF1697 family)
VPRYVAFLRAINVGGHVVKMNVLREQFEALGFTDVETFIASGNVLFSSRIKNVPALERRIEGLLKAALGYEVATFVRTCDEVSAMAAYAPFPRAMVRTAVSVWVGFLAAPMPPAAQKALQALETPFDTFHVNGREIYWLRRKKQSESTLSNTVIERALKARCSFRGMNTIVRLRSRLPQ